MQLTAVATAYTDAHLRGELQTITSGASTNKDPQMACIQAMQELMKKLQKKDWGAIVVTIS